MDGLKAKSEVLAQLFSLWQPSRKFEKVSIKHALGRITSEPVHARFTLPVKRASGMDGVAVISERFAQGIPDTSHWSLDIDYARADTGDDFDDRFDAVIPIEKVTFTENGKPLFNVETPVVPGIGVRSAGCWVQEGELLIDAHKPLRATDLAALALGGIAEVSVITKPVIGYIPTGSELVPVGVTPARGQNVDSNSILLDCLLREIGAEPLILPIVHDNRQQLEENLQQALKRTDVLIIGGGTSKGCEDLCADLLKKQGNVICHGVAVAPGRPLCLALIDGKPVINLPGPPVAAFYGFDWCIRAIICQWLSIPLPQRKKVMATLTEDFPCPDQISFMRRANLRRNEQGEIEASPLGMGKSIPQMLCTDALYITVPGEGDHKKGSQIEVELLREEFQSDFDPIPLSL